MGRLWIMLLAAWSGFLAAVVPSEGAATARGDLPPVPDFETLEIRLQTESTNAPLLISAALAFHNRAAFGDKNAETWLGRSRHCLEQVLQLDPQHTFAKTLLGSATVISARDAFWPGTKIRRVRDGLALMDAALAANPDDPDARFTRASNNLFLPSLFHRDGIVRADFEWLQVRADRGEFVPDFRQYVHLYHGMALRLTGETEAAQKLWEAGLAVDPNSKVAAELRDALSGHSSLARLPHG